VEIVEINGLNEPTEYGVVDENFRPTNVNHEYEQCIARARQMGWVYFCDRCESPIPGDMEIKLTESDEVLCGTCK